MAEIFSDADIDFREYEESTNHKQTVKSASIYVQALIDRANNPIKEKRTYMPWGKTRHLIQFRPGEVTVWGGPNGSGKSLITGQAALSLCGQDERVCIASFEMKPMKTLGRMGRQFTGSSLDDAQIMSDPTERATLLDQYAEFRDWTRDRLWLYDRQGTVEWHHVCAVVRYAARELRVGHMFIDNLAKCVKDEDDHNGQKAFVDELCAIARDEDIHIHLVHHIKKPPNEDHVSTKYDFKGSGAIVDQPDNVIAVWRNKKKEQMRRDGKTLSDNEPDTKLNVDKQRNGEGWEGHIGLWWHPQSNQYLPSHNAPPMTFWTPAEDDAPWMGHEH